MSTHSEESHGLSNKLTVTVWAWLLILTGVEVFLAYIQFSVRTMLVMLMGLSLIKAALIMAYFMHLRFEKRTLVLTLIPALVVVASTLAVFFPDSLRLLHMKPW
ncbi:MAG: cytochrome C oxidase subunit IV family protein [Acidobacteria bacterium]|nr:cytochrome C oxidase subunit IV family protein [Acidobacteriota bacterium]MCI0625448.1 cytochrome C oxidase subunit IV family protein [Acidobacteriota bacterium]